MATRIPVNKDSYSFDDRQRVIWEDMERRRREWEDEIDKTRNEFFHLRPEHAQFAGLNEGMAASRLLAAGDSGRPPVEDDGKAVIVTDGRGQPAFQVSFNMKQYTPDEVSVKMDATKIMVSAKHEETDSGSIVSTEYSREVEIPRDVDPQSLQCTLSSDGFLVVHAPLPAPSYSTVRDSATASHNPLGLKQSTSSYQTSSTLSSMPPSSMVSKPISASSEHLQASVDKSKLPAAFPQSTFNQEDAHSRPPDYVLPSYKPAQELANPTSADRHLNQSLSSVCGPYTQTSTLPKLAPFNTLSSTFSSSNRFPEASNALAVTSHNGKFQLTMLLEDYKPEELTVKTQDDKVVICARRELTSGNRTQTMEMSREHSLPGNVDPLTVKAFFTDTNSLIVEAPFINSQD